MKLGIQLIANDASVNNFRPIKRVRINQQESLNLVFQLVNVDQKGIRFLPSANAIVLVEIPRFPDVVGTYSNQRQYQDFSVRRNAAMLFPTDDRSIWYIPLTSQDTANMGSSNIRVTVTDGQATYIALLSQALVVTRSEIDAEPNGPDPIDEDNNSGTF